MVEDSHRYLGRDVSFPWREAIRDRDEIDRDRLSLLVECIHMNNRATPFRRISVKRRWEMAVSGLRNGIVGGKHGEMI